MDIDVSSFRSWVNSLPTPVFSPRVAVRKSTMHGQGLYACADILPGEILVYDQGLSVPASVVELGVLMLGHENALRIDWDTYALDAPIDGGAYINHSCDPNAGLANARTFVAIRNIPVDTEICMDYSTSETWKEWSMQCSCESSGCRGIIRGTDHENIEFRAKLGRWFSPYLKKYYGISENAK